MAGLSEKKGEKSIFINGSVGCQARKSCHKASGVDVRGGAVVVNGDVSKDMFLALFCRDK